MDEKARSKRAMREMEAGNDDDEDDEEGEEEEEEEAEDAGDADESFDAMDGVEAEQPGESTKKAKSMQLDEQEDDKEEILKEIDVSSLSRKEQKRIAKRERKQEKRAAKKTQKDDESHAQTSIQPKESTKLDKHSKTAKLERKQAEENELVKGVMDDDTDMVLDGFDDGEGSPEVSAPQSPTFDSADAATANNDPTNEPASTTTSVSSTIPPSEKPKHIKIPADTSMLRARLEAKIAALRAARKADGPDGKPIRTRQELIESRRAKQVQRKEHKQEMRRLAKLEADRKREEALATNSPSIMSPAVEVDEAGSFSFGRVAFADGSQMSHDLSYVLNQGKKKGPSDAKTALLKVQNQKKRLQAMDEDQRKDIAEKDAWLTARRRAEGEKIRDDEAHLKKTIRRKESTKRKSERQWQERINNQDHTQEARQKKREENLKKRRDDKILRKAGKKKKSKAGSATKKKKSGRPGFEGSFGMGGKRK